MGAKEEIGYILARCPGLQGEEWGCMARIPEGWTHSHFGTTSEGTPYRVDHTVEAKNVSCNCTSEPHSCTMTVVHTRTVVILPLFEHHSERVTPPEFEILRKHSSCLPVVPRQGHHKPGGGGGPGPEPPVPPPGAGRGFPGVITHADPEADPCARWHDPTISKGDKELSCVGCCNEKARECHQRAGAEKTRHNRCQNLHRNCLAGCPDRNPESAW